MTMNPDRWNRISDLFHLALATDPAERQALLDELGTTDPDLRKQVDALLRAHAADVSVLDRGPEALASVLADDDEAATPDRIGPYRVLRVLGHGGMGAVYLAEREGADFRQLVAVKCLLPGVATHSLVERFRRERRILASLLHPHIARLYDGGSTADGRPYLVMEHVEGTRIDRWCDERRLDVDGRLKLFETVCEAVQYAHGRLVVHRDLKPSNILVKDSGEVVLLDFGIAKLLSEDGAEDATRLGARPLTPEYASPEQLRGEPASTAADIYGLGVVLHELLAGCKPSWQARLVAGSGASDLDLSLEPPSRALVRRDADDRDGQTVALARGSTPDQLRRRLRGDLDTIVLTALQPDASRRYASVQALLDDVRRFRAGQPVSARRPTLAYRARKFVRRNPALIAAASLVLLLGIGYMATVLVQSRRIAAERDRAEGERVRAERVVDVLAGVFGSADPLARERLDTMRVADVVARASERVSRELAEQPLVLAELLTVLGRVHQNLSRYPDSRALLEEAVALQRADPGARPLALAESLNRLGMALQREGRAAEAEAAYRESLAIRVAQDAPAHLIAGSLTNLGGTLQDQTKFDSAAALYDRAFDLLDAQPSADSAVLANMLNQRAALAMRMDDLGHAAELTERIVQIQRGILGPDHPDFAMHLANYGGMLYQTGRPAEAEGVLREAIDVALRALGEEHAIVISARELLGNALARLGRLDDAESMLSGVVEQKRRVFGPANPQFATALSAHGDVLGRLGRHADAAAAYREAFEINNAAREWRGAGITLARFARTRCRMGEGRTAVADFRESIRMLEGALPPASPFVIGAHRELGACHATLGDWPLAEAELLDAYTRANTQFGTTHPETLASARELVNLYDASGEMEKKAEYQSVVEKATPDTTTIRAARPPT